MKPVLKEILLTLLYLTPIGYILSLYKLHTGESTPGVYVNFNPDEPIGVSVKKNPTTQDRIHWFINGIFLLTQAFTILLKNLGGDLGGTYAWIALIFGAVSTIAAIFPTLDWNGKLFKVINISIIWVLVILFLILATFVYSDIFKFLLNKYQ